MWEVPVQGGTLHGATWGENGPWVLALHGVTGSHVQFQPLADQLAGEVRLVAPDLRGRGRSNGIPGPWGMAAHADDLVAVLDHLKIPRADLVVGSSMGGFVAAVAGARNPERYASILMVDGGLPLFDVRFITWLPFSSFIIEKIVRKILGPSLERLEMRFASREAYRDFWRPHPALRGNWSEYFEAYLDYDLQGEPPNLTARTSKQGLLLDARTQLIEHLVPDSLRQLTCPVHFLAAPRGLLDDKPLYPPDKVARASRGIARFTTSMMDDVNHYTSILSVRGAKAVAAEVRARVG